MEYWHHSAGPSEERPHPCCLFWHQNLIPQCRKLWPPTYSMNNYWKHVGKSVWPTEKNSLPSLLIPYAIVCLTSSSWLPVKLHPSYNGLLRMLMMRSKVSTLYWFNHYFHLFPDDAFIFIFLDIEVFWHLCLFFSIFTQKSFCAD